MRITTKGQVTIPQDIRERLGLLPHMEVEFTVDGDSVRIRKAARPARARGQTLVDHIRGRGTTKMTTDEIMKLTRG